MHPFLPVIEKLIVKIRLESGFYYCTKNPEVSDCALSDDELIDVITESKIKIDLSKIISLEVSHLPEGSTPLAARDMTPDQVRETNVKVLNEIEGVKKTAQDYAKEYCSNYETCLRLILNEDIKKADLDYYCFLEVSPDDDISESAIVKSCREKWAECISSKKNKAVEMLNNEKEMAESDGDLLASEEIDSLLELIESAEEEAEATLSSASSVGEILNYWPALLLPAPPLASHASKFQQKSSNEYWNANKGCLHFSMYDKIFNKDIIFANNNSYLTFEEIDQKQKGFFTMEDFKSAHCPTFGEEGIEEYFFRVESYKNVKDKLPELSSKMASRITKEDWLNFISEENPYNIASKTDLHSCGSDSTTKATIPWQDRRRIKEEETKKIFENDELLIVHPLSYQSMVLYGYETKWCYSSAATKEHYEDVKDFTLFFIIFNRPKKEKENHKFLLSVNQKTGKWLFEDQANRLLTDKTIYDSNMNALEKRSSRHLDFLFKNFSAMEKLQCATYLESQTS